MISKSLVGFCYYKIFSCSTLSTHTERNDVVVIVLDDILSAQNDNVMIDENTESTRENFFFDV